MAKLHRIDETKSNQLIKVNTEYNEALYRKFLVKDFLSSNEETASEEQLRFLLGHRLKCLTQDSAKLYWYDAERFQVSHNAKSSLPMTEWKFSAAILNDTLYIFPCELHEKLAYKIFIPSSEFINVILFGRPLSFSLLNTVDFWCSHRKRLLNFYKSALKSEQQSVKSSGIDWDNNISFSTVKPIHHINAQVKAELGNADNEQGLVETQPVAIPTFLSKQNLQQVVARQSLELLMIESIHIGLKQLANLCEEDDCLNERLYDVALNPDHKKAFSNLVERLQGGKSYREYLVEHAHRLFPIY